MATPQPITLLFRCDLCLLIVVVRLKTLRTPILFEASIGQCWSHVPKGHIEVIRALVAQGGPSILDIQDADGQSPLLMLPHSSVLPVSVI